MKKTHTVLFHAIFLPCGRWRRTFWGCCLALAFLSAGVHNNGNAAAADAQTDAVPREDYIAGTGDAAGQWTDSWTTPSGDRYTVVEPPAQEPYTAPQPLVVEPRIFPVVPHDVQPHFGPEHRHNRGGY